MAFRTFDNQFDFDRYDDDDADTFVAGERLCAPSATARGSTLLPAVVVIAFLCGVAWLFVSYPAAWQAIVSAALTARDARQDAAPLPDAAPPPPPTETRDIAAAPGADAGEALPSPPPELAAQSLPPEAAEPASQASAAQSDGNDKPAPLSQPKADPSDPNQKRALAAGLHPDLSRALLARLSEADYSNARSAIQTALAETPDEQVFTWPREANAKRAQFEVHFVAGMSAECRRYVVIVSKDRWSTTAPPMEKCGGDLPKRKLARKAG
jgi:hypothetical protein